jgi:dipeptidyl aminopeptidase/acylaminoacyl peptidase
MENFINLKTLISLPAVDPELGFELSPDGTKVAYSSNATGRWEIYVLDLANPASPQQITRTEGAKFAPRWSPDGHKLAYVLDLTGAEDYDIWEYDTSTQQHRNLTPNTPEALSSEYSWSPDGKQIAFCSDKDNRFDTYIMSPEDGEARKVLDTSNQDWVADWSPDGRYLAVTSEAVASDYWTYIVPVAGGAPWAISLDNSPICSKHAAWSSDSKTLAFSSDISGSFRIGLYKVETREITWLDLGEGEIELPDWSPDSKDLVAVANHGPTTKLLHYSFEDKKLETYQYEPGVIYTPKFTRQGDQILFVFDNPRYPDNLWLLTLSDSRFTQLTSSLPDGADRDLLVMPQEVTYPGLDGVSVPALLYRPAQQSDDLPPGVVYVHGGPNWLTQVTWDPFVQDMVSRGWVVLAPNYRGSTGYGHKWQVASRFDLGGVDTNDVVAGANYLDEHGLADPHRIAVTGRSWGGYLTMTCLTQYPDRWAAGSASVPFLNWFTSHKNSREDLQHWDIQNFGTPEENYDLWYERSPYFFLDKIKAPVQLICGAHDVRCPASESKQAYEELTRLGLPCEYVVLEDEGHAILKLENQIKAKLARLDFLALHLESK